jgi:hypothetical protein
LAAVSHAGILRAGTQAHEHAFLAQALIVTVHVTAEVITIDLGGDDSRTVRRTTTQPFRSIKAQQHRQRRSGTA